MVRTQIQLSEEQAAFLKVRAASEGVPMVEASSRRHRAAAIAGQFRSGIGDVAENHDKYLAHEYAK